MKLVTLKEIFSVVNFSPLSILRSASEYPLLDKAQKAGFRTSKGSTYKEKVGPSELRATRGAT